MTHRAQPLERQKLVFFLFHLCDVPGSVHRDNTDEGVDAECNRDGANECTFGLPADIRLLFFSSP